MAASMDGLMAKTLETFASLTTKPEKFLSFQNATCKRFKTVTKNIYDSESKHLSIRTTGLSLPELIVDQFDDEQIWQQLELKCDQAVDSLTSNVAHLLKNLPSVAFLTPGNKNIKKLKTKLKILEENPENDEIYDHDIDNNEDDESRSSDDSNVDEEIENIKNRFQVSSKKIEEIDSGSDLDFDFPALGVDLNEDNDEELDENSDEELPEDKIIQDDEEKFSDKKPETKSSSKTRETEVDDKFFKLSDMETFLEREDAKELKLIRREEGGKQAEETTDEEEEDIDLFDELPADEDNGQGKDMHYDDFFEPPHDSEDQIKHVGMLRKKVRFSGIGKDSGVEDNASEADSWKEEDVQGEVNDDESESEGEELSDILGGKKKNKVEIKSTFEQRQEKLKNRIQTMENSALGDKPWQLAGEINASGRPENSLLQEHLQFEHTTRLPPVITEETTKTLEELITQRIKDKTWDDVERKEKRKEDLFEYKKRIVLDQEKSQKSLGEIYEQEYLKLQQLKYQPDKSIILMEKDEDEKEDPKHDVIRKMMQSLFVKLDALSNFHYTPKPLAPDVKIVSNMPSIAIEEVAPVSVSDAKLLAPQEIESKVVGEEKGKTEKTETDRKRERRKKKKDKRIRQKDKQKRQKLVDKLKPGLGNKYSKEKAMKELEKKSKHAKGRITMAKDNKNEKRVKISSRSFFSQLQEEVSTQLISHKAQKRRTDKNEKQSAKMLKL